LLPGLAVAEALLSRGHRVRLLVSEKAVDQTALAALNRGSDPSAFSVKALGAVGYRGVRQAVPFCCRLAAATRACVADCAEFAPDAVLGMGGFTSAPAVFAARWRKVPAVVHESNAVPGKANRLVGRWADQVALGLADCARHFAGRPVTVTGTPIRAALRQGRVADARARLGLRDDRRTVLVVGGSQGAHAVNEAVVNALPALAAWRDRWQFVHVSGTKDETFVRAAYDRNGLTAVVMGFCSTMELAYSAADLAVSRAGAATLAELAVFGLPAVLVPLPTAAGNHQWLNARVAERAGAARVLEQSQLAGLADAVAGLLHDDAARQRMAAAARALAMPDAEQRIADLVEQCTA
jgi:UDP-N-acetylglucosamine--N-acetylmuramyl-(pentapeptide) pyrophosphoryl-undecaprenol N-acetylglucosamine transferase